MNLSDATFQQFKQWLKLQTGVHLSDLKKTLVHQRLLKRLHVRKMPTFEAYYRLIHQVNEETERQLALDLLTTHETYFFREPKHFEWLKLYVRQRKETQVLRIWSAAASSGEEVWSIAMLLADLLGIQGPWQLLGSDISQPVLDKARSGHYVIQRCEDLPQSYLKKFCLKGHGKQSNTLLIERELRKRVDFMVVNLNQNLPNFGSFDVIFLRNVLIYFDTATKSQVVERCIECLKPGGHIIVSHSESLTQHHRDLRLVQAGVYQKLL